MVEKIKELEAISRLLDPSPGQREAWDTAVLQHARSFLDALDQEKAYFVDEPTGDDLGDLDIAEASTDLSYLLQAASTHIDGVGINPASGGHLGYIPGGGLYPAALGDYLAAVTNRYVGVFFASPGALRLEDRLIRCMCQLMGYPETATGNLTSGGSIANLVAVVTAREAQGIKARDIERCVIYLSEQAHHSLQKALRIAGLSEAHLNYIPLDPQLRLSASALEKAIKKDKEQGLRPFFVNASCGTTNTGAIDPMRAISDIAKDHSLWFHVDAAYGGFFKLVSTLEAKFEGIEHADSITLDPHKTLFLPFGTGTILIKSQKKAMAAHYYLADYMQDTVDAANEVSPADVSPELTKHFRGLRLWLPLKLFGLRPFRAALEEKLLLARYFYDQVGRLQGYERGPVPELSVAMFRYVGSHTAPNLFNERLIREIQKDGRIFLSSTTIDDEFWIRAAIVTFRAHLSHVDLLLRIIQEKVVFLLQEEGRDYSIESPAASS